MKKTFLLIFTALILTTLCACAPKEELPPEETIIGFWETARDTPYFLGLEFREDGTCEAIFEESKDERRYTYEVKENVVYLWKVGVEEHPWIDFTIKDNGLYIGDELHYQKS